MRLIKALFIVACVCLWWNGTAIQAVASYLGRMKADKILVLGNSITSCHPNWWGLDASKEATDYVHLLGKSIDARTGGHLPLVLTDGTPAGGAAANVVNIAGIFERGYATYTASQLQSQIDAKPDIVVLQIGENVPTDATFNATAFKNGLRTLLTDLKQSSNPEVFVTSCIMYPNWTVDAIKQQICAEDSAHRTYVDLSAIRLDAANNLSGYAGHPGDKGMAFIADKLFDAMVAHSVPEPSCAVLSSAAIAAVLAYAWRKRKQIERHL
jgi:lysophospholipase L1-like esterase